MGRSAGACPRLSILFPPLMKQPQALSMRLSGGRFDINRDAALGDAGHSGCSTRTQASSHLEIPGASYRRRLRHRGRTVVCRAAEIDGCPPGPRDRGRCRAESANHTDAAPVRGIVHLPPILRRAPAASAFPRQCPAHQASPAHVHQKRVRRRFHGMGFFMVPDLSRCRATAAR